MRAADIRVENHGSIYLLRPHSESARWWLAETFDYKGYDESNAPTWFGDALVVEPRYVADIVNGAREAGLEVR